MSFTPLVSHACRATVARLLCLYTTCDVTTLFSHANANHAVSYPVPYSTSPYGSNLPSSAPPQAQLPPNYTMPGQQMPQYQMNASGMPVQQAIPRMYPSQQPQAHAIMSPQRPFHPQGTPPTMSTPQFPNGHPQNIPQSHTPIHVPSSVTSVATPQTPTLSISGHTPPQVTNNAPAPSDAPLSPSPNLLQQRYDIILDINAELLYEFSRLQKLKEELQKENSSPEQEEQLRLVDTDSKL
jgi:hypothetical protein